MENIEYKIDILRQVLYDEINTNEELCSVNIVELSQKLDKLIVDAYKQELNINNE